MTEKNSYYDFAPRRKALSVRDSAILISAIVTLGCAQSPLRPPRCSNAIVNGATIQLSGLSMVPKSAAVITAGNVLVAHLSSLDDACRAYRSAGQEDGGIAQEETALTIQYDFGVAPHLGTYNIAKALTGDGTAIASIVHLPLLGAPWQPDRQAQWSSGTTSIVEYVAGDHMAGSYALTQDPSLATGTFTATICSPQKCP